MQIPLNARDFLRRGSTVYPDRVAVVDEADGPGSLGALSFAELAARARGLANRLAAMGIEPGDRVAIVSQNSARFLISLFGVSGYGRVLVPVNFRLNAEEVSYIIAHSGARLMLVDPSLADSLAAVEVEQRIVLDGEADRALFAPDDTEPDCPPVAENDTATVNYTSGTTSRPKGVELTQRNLWLNATVFGLHVGVSDRDVYLHTLPMFHCNGWGMPYILAGLGAKQIVLRQVDGEEILRRIEAEGVTLLCGAPAVVSAILDAATARHAAGTPLPGRVRMVVAGAPPPSRVIERVETELGWEFIQIYGLTETSPLLTINRAPAEWDELPPPERAQRLSRAGVPALGVDIAVAADGEVLARSNHVFEGYWQQPEQSAAALAGGWFHSGDGGYLDGPYLAISDRKKDVIISGGENVSSIEVEDVLFRNPKIAEAAVIGVPDEKWGETVKALLVLRPGMQADAAEIIAFCREQLAHYKCPTTVEFRDSLPRTATGKLQKFKLRAAYW